VPDDTGAATEEIPAQPPLEYHSSDELSGIGSIAGDALNAELQRVVGFVPVEGSVDIHGHSPTAVAELGSAVVQYVKKSQKKRTRAKNTINDLYARLNGLEQGVKAANLKIANLEQGVKAANLKTANLDGRVKKIELEIANLDGRVKKIA
jgi:hypothetical protein